MTYQHIFTNFLIQTPGGKSSPPEDSLDPPLVQVNSEIDHTLAFYIEVGVNISC